MFVLAPIPRLDIAYLPVSFGRSPVSDIEAVFCPYIKSYSGHPKIALHTGRWTLVQYFSFIHGHMIISSLFHYPGKGHGPLSRMLGRGWGPLCFSLQFHLSKSNS